MGGAHCPKGPLRKCKQFFDPMLKLQARQLKRWHAASLLEARFQAEKRSAQPLPTLFIRSCVAESRTFAAPTRVPIPWGKFIDAIRAEFVRTRCSIAGIQLPGRNRSRFLQRQLLRTEPCSAVSIYQTVFTPKLRIFGSFVAIGSPVFSA
jgi:hypothetical protein